ncbi:MAG: acyltransferase [Chitinophagaceae bacterium]|jgi:peptidoglycan/LPS O-acetylase OafA/YrhL
MKNFLTLRINYNSKEYIPHLDGIRGIAILLVLFAHFCRFQPFTKLAEGGWIGVDLFFVLSGFLITGILLESKEKANFFKNFYARRTLRIFPVYYLLLVVLLLIIPFTGIKLPEGYDYFLKVKLFYFLYFQNNLPTFDGWPPNEMLSHLWSLAIEEQFYLIWPLVIYFCNKKQIIFFSVIVILASILLRYSNPEVTFAYFSSLTRFDGLILGGIVAIMIRFHKKVLEQFAPLVFIAVIIGLGYALWNTQWKFSNSNYYFIRWGYTAISIFWCCILVFSFSAGRFSRLVNLLYNNRFIKYCGKISYGLYLFHMVIYGFFAGTLVSFFRSFKIENLDEHGLLVSICILVMTFMVSMFSFKFFESPILKLKARFH